MPADSQITSGAVIGLSKIFNFLLGLWVYLFLFFGYCQFYFIIDRSISVRIMIELEKTPDKKLSMDQIQKIYKPEYIFSRRMQHLVDSKYIVEESGFYRNRRSGQISAKVFRFLKNYLNIGEGG
ncbi:MAG: hypothetical protein ABH869_03060 [Candidatus Omnitrophota bacterium]